MAATPAVDAAPDQQLRRNKRGKRHGDLTKGGERWSRELQVGAVEEIRVEPAGLESGKNRLRASGLGTGGGG